MFSWKFLDQVFQRETTVPTLCDGEYFLPVSTSKKRFIDQRRKRGNGRGRGRGRWRRGKGGAGGVVGLFFCCHRWEQ